MLQEGSSRGETLLIIERADFLLVEVFHLFEGFKLCHELLEMATALSRSSSFEEGAERFENASGPELMVNYLRFSLEMKIFWWKSIKRTYWRLYSSVHFPSMPF